MTERIRALLDGVADEVRPRTADPVGSVLRRSRVQRRRRVALTTAGLATLTMLLGGVAVLHPARPADPAPAASPTATTATVPVAGGPVRPRLVGDQVVTAGFTLPVPTGWTVVQDRHQDICETAPRTLFLNGGAVPGGPCPGTQPLISVAPYDPARLPLDRPVRQQLPLPGGQPGWLANTTLDQTAGDAYRSVMLLVPWSGVMVTISGPGTEVRRILDTVRTAPATPSRLVLPPDVKQLIFFSPAGKPRPWLGGRSDEATVRQVLDLLATLTDVVDDRSACPAAEDPATLTLATARTGPSIVFTSVDGCEQATSALGGRVRLPAGFLAQLAALFQGQGR